LRTVFRGQIEIEKKKEGEEKKRKGKGKQWGRSDEQEKGGENARGQEWKSYR